MQDGLLTIWGSEHYGWHFADDISKQIFFAENCWFFIQISPKFIPEGRIDNKYVIVGSGHGLAPIRRQAITWTNVDPVHWSISVTRL